MEKIGYIKLNNSKITFNQNDFDGLIRNIRRPLHIVYEPSRKSLGLSTKGEISSSSKDGLPLIASFPAMYPEWLGDRNFLETHNLRFAYVGGAMARGIASTKMVIELAKIGMLGFFGSAGMSLGQLEKEISYLSETLDNKSLSWGANIIHTPNDLLLEDKIVDLYLKYGVRRVSAAAFTGVAPSLVRFLAKGLYRDKDGIINRKNYIFAKISHPEVAKAFLSPAPEAILNDLVSKGRITFEQGELAKQIPLAEDIDVESDSGGHTDNRPLGPFFPTIVSLRNEISEKYGYKKRPRIGAAGGIGTPQAVASAFALGASHISLGSVHQGTVEAGTSTEVKEMLSKAGISDVIMTSSADMFEMGVKVQVLKRGTMMGVRGNYLYELYKKFDGIEDIPQKIRTNIEKNIFKMPLDKVWEKTREYFTKVEPEQISLDENDRKHKMALVFRWYLGNSSRWPIIGQKDRLTDYQIWCGPAMGAFNNWVKGTFLEPIQNRSIGQIALNLMEGGAVLTRFHQLRTYGLPLKEESFSYIPERLKID